MKKETYLMLGGTFLPAFIVLGVAMAIKKEAKLDAWDILLFTGATAIGGSITARILKK